MSKLRVLPVGAQGEWLDALRACDRYDFFHLPEFHALAEANGEGTARCSFTRKDHIGWPSRSCCARWPTCPAASQPMPCARTRPRSMATQGLSAPMPSCRETWWPAFSASWRRPCASGGWSVSSPGCILCLSSALVLAGLGDCVPGQLTVSLDLTLPEAEQRARVPANHSDAHPPVTQARCHLCSR